MRLAWLILPLVGCAPPATLEEACVDAWEGSKSLDDAGYAFFHRVTCHRRFVGLSAAKVAKEAQGTAEDHAAYLDGNGILDPQSEHYAQTLDELFLEDETLQAYTGFSLLDRFRGSGWYLATEGNVGTWDLLLNNADVDVDALIADPYLRDIFFQPGWLGAGMATFLHPETGGTAGYMNLLYAFPPASRMARPVVFPRDGQIDVPVGFTTYGAEEDPLSAVRVAGYPITVTVGAEEITGRDNPYELTLLEATLTDSGGAELPLLTAMPGIYPWGNLNATVITAAIRPLDPGETYTFRATVRWNWGERDVEATFTTVGDVPDPVARTSWRRRGAGPDLTAAAMRE